MFIETYGIIINNNSLCQLIRDYIEDIVVLSILFKEFKINPVDKKYIFDRNSWAKALDKGGSLKDKHWDGKGEVCAKLHKSLLYVQAYHLSNLLMTTDFDHFLTAFNKSYNGKKELELARRIHSICRENNWLDNKKNYDNALEDIKNIEYLGLKEAQIKHFVKREVGFVLK